MLFQFSLMGVEAIVVSLLFLLLYWLRPILGLAGLYIAIGAFQYLQVLLALSVYVEIMPGVLVSPGSAVLFSGSIFAILLIYIEEDTVGTRKLIYGLIFASIALSALATLFGFHIDSPVTKNFFNLPKELFFQTPRLWIIGTLALTIDTFLLIIIFEAVSRYVTKLLFPRIFITMVFVLIFDSFFFVTGMFYGSPQYSEILISGIIGKSVISFFYSMVLVAYLHLFHKAQLTQPDLPILDIFKFLTYRQKYEELKRVSIRDSLTGVFNRDFFETTLPREIEQADTSRRSVTLILVDLDHFKAINDNLGHQEGDRILSATGSILTQCLRSKDLAFRYGGEEFVLILPDTEKKGGRILADRIRSELKDGLRISLLGQESSVTATLGLATFPDETSNAAELIELADKRLYIGKRGGRDCVVDA